MKSNKIFSMMLAIIFAVSFSSCGAKSDPYEGVAPDFRNVNWGMTLEEVQDREGSEGEVKDNGTVKYIDQSIIGLNCTLEYSFYGEGSTLNGAEYRINIDKLSHKDIHDSFVKIYSQLTEKYGEPSDLMFSVQDTKDNFYFDINDDVPADLEFRSAVYSAKWDKSNLKINLSIPFSGATPQWIELKYTANLSDDIDTNI